MLLSKQSVGKWIDRKRFLRDLEMVKFGLSLREFIEQSSCFVFQGGEVMTFNEEIACRKRIGINVKGAVQSELLLETLKLLKDRALKVMVNKKGELEFQGKERRFKLTRSPKIFLPIDRVKFPHMEDWRALPDQFLDAVALVLPCVSGDFSNGVLKSGLAYS